MFGKPSHSQSGFSLIEVLIGFGLLSILGYASMSLISSQNKEMRALDEKMSMQSTQLLVTNLLSGADYCKCFFEGHRFNRSTLSWNSLPNEIPAAYGPSCAPSGSPILKIGTAVQNLKPTSISIVNITEVTTGMYSGNLQIQMDQELLMRSRKPVTLSVFFKPNAADPPGSQRIESCSANSDSMSSAAPVPFQVFVNRNSYASINIPPNLYRFCYLSSVQTGGNDGGGGDRCEIAYQTWSQTWILSGQRGDDPGVTCKALCIPK